MMLEWLISPMDPDRVHDVGLALSWHARTMVLGWGILAPLAILTARYLKVLPSQNWPRELDNKTWWRCHWMGQSVVLVLSAVGLCLVLLSSQNTGHEQMHRSFGYCVLALGCFQGLSGLLRGTKGGPTSPVPDGSLRGDHYDMTLRRQLFESFHKIFGYLALVMMMGAVGSGLWATNAPRWMWFVLSLWWTGLTAAALVLQRNGWAVDTYQAIWGPDPVHPGNRTGKSAQAATTAICSKKRDM
ncbi:hypothetical protein SIAM614_31181 [Roseibium aggregatum IAM 12614]|uniref:Cytochrome b561 domain-containing protein n=1 Tax=Roseibium aggregatum (strain ATCC 25650 / DSM 13394 / JCM 20685 / NBRC 16684 / NCIMB 2208 / IAM 12614 / B1) TaxID=384765 RepID=A0NZE8_ROSAI|nr:cytochrome b561 domain-containing protein [Roseibium aggregatum]EAV41827.1 hypothetical protein SIAM614_31181 [Roseibium aggregatum IAM 12614]